MDNNDASDDSDGRDNLIISIVALAISLIALIATSAQVLHQYFSSNANCSERVMGKWYNSAKRAFQWTSLRWEVEFDAPVLFVCSPGTERGPIKGNVHKIDGSLRSRKDTRSDEAGIDAPNAEPRRPGKRVIHTADNERATWVTLLEELQGMEYESRKWQTKLLGYASPVSNDLPDVLKDRSLVVAVQAKRRSWASMPSSVKKPYATTTICHMLEMAAIMGIYWREFDRSNNRYRAEGNGYVLTGSQVPELGLMFEFQICGQRTFKENRVIPVHEVKELSFGILTTLFREDSDPRMLNPVEDSENLHWLQLGSQDEIAESLVLLRCNTNTANCLRDNEKKHGHLFPVVFELVGMLGKTLHIPNTPFRMLPNPTPYHWDKKFFTLHEMLEEFRKNIKDYDSTEQTARTEQLVVKADNVKRQLQRKNRPVEEYDVKLLGELHNALDDCDRYLLHVARRDLLFLVLREHFQIILQMINHEGQDQTGNGTSDGGGRGQAGDATHHRPPFDEVYSASPEERQAKFMEIYFLKVLPTVKERAVEAHRRRTTMRELSRTGSARSAPTEAAAAGVTTADDSSGGLVGVEVTRAATTTSTSGHVASRGGGQGNALLQTQASDIWCTLVFRMLCYLLLHDFHKKDVQIPKGELVGSRLPVYIA